jgi:FAD/FMN-containing dehydrogenase
VGTLSAPPDFRGIFRDDREARAVYAEAAGIQQVWPLAVAVATAASDVTAVVRWARDHALPLVPRGAGTSMPGGAIGSGVILDLSQLRHAGAVDPAQQRIWVEPGVRRDEVDAAAHAVGLRFPVDPSSGAFCTVGGMASTNAAGAHSLKYGSIRPWVTALDCVFSDGTRATVRRGQPTTDIPSISRFLHDVAPQIRAADPKTLRHPGVRKDSSGYAVAEFASSGEVIDLLVGSEGTLAVFVGLELALCAQPRATTSLLAAFPSLETAVAGAAAAQRAGASACEMLDRTFLDLVREATHTGAAGAMLPQGTEVVLLIELEGEAAPALAAVTRSLERALREASAAHVAVALDADAAAALWDLRHAASPVLAQLDPALKSMQFIEDGAVPPDRLADYVRGVRAALARHGVRGAIFGHAGDAHVHVNPLIDIRRANWRDQVAGLLTDVTALTATLGGTLTGEHGDGRLRAPLLDKVWGGPASPALHLFAAVKAAFDPDGLFNPGVKVPAPGERPIEAVKYDPALPPLPPAARRALDHVAEHRAYAVSRLDLLRHGDAAG